MHICRYIVVHTYNIYIYIEREREIRAQAFSPKRLFEPRAFASESSEGRWSPILHGRGEEGSAVGMYKFEFRGIIVPLK